MEFGGQDTTALIWLAFGLLAAGAGAGLMAGLLGVGGGIVMVPALYTVFPIVGVPEEVAMHLAVGTSLAAIIPTAVISARSHNKRGAVDWSLLKLWAPAIVVGVMLGAYLGGKATGAMLTGFFGTVVVLMALKMALQKEGKVLLQEFPGGWRRFAMGMVVGVCSTIMGIGGATFSVPMMTACNIPMRRAVGTASAIGFCIAVPGAIGFVISGWGEADLPLFSLGFVNLLGFAIMIPATMTVAPLGAKIAHSIDPKHLRYAFAAFLLVTGTRMLYTTFF